MHRRVEASLLPPFLWTRAHYGAMLQAFHRVIAPAEPALCDLLGDVFIPPPPLSRAERIQADLRAIGLDVPPTPHDHHLIVESRADAYGVGYVLQGSLLGGAVIARQLRAGCGDQPVPTGYLELYGDGLSGAWKRFCHAANSFGRESGDDERRRATQAAIDTFRAVERALAHTS
jgi:heme oxygenase